MGRMILGGAIDARKAAEPPTAGVAAMKVSSAAAAPSSKPAAAGGGASSAPVLLPGQPSPAAVAKASQAAKPYGRWIALQLFPSKQNLYFSEFSIYIYLLINF